MTDLSSARTGRTRILDLDSRQDNIGLSLRTFLLAHLAGGTVLLKDHLRMAAAVRVGVVIAHGLMCLSCGRETSQRGGGMRR
jgi:hypothetical protein